jgi:mitochondrial fission protein ELM1
MSELRPHGIKAEQSWPLPLPTCWCVTDGRPGMENQTVGLAEAMGLRPVIKRVVLKTLWRIASPHITAFKRYAMSERGDQLSPPWPDILIATGRPSILPALFVKGQSGGRTFTVQLQDPVSLRWRFDRIVVPAHDGLSGDNVIVMDGALHRVTPEILAGAAAQWADRLAVPRPTIAVLLGGNNSRYRLGAEEMAALGQQLRALSAQGYGLLITPSRRTGDENMAILEAALADCPAFIWDGSGENPYFGMLALADALIVTCDSVNMISEACSTGKPVHVLSLPAQGRRGSSERDKFTRFHRRLEATGRIRFFTGKIENWSYEPLLEMERVSDLIRNAYLSRKL